MAVLILLFSTLVLVYPFVSNYLFENRTDSLISTYERQAESAEDSTLKQLWSDAEAYNQALVERHALLSDPFEVFAERLDTETYLSLLSLHGSEVMSYIDIPKIGIYLPIYHGTEVDTLEKGVGHLEGSSLPIGGESSHCVLSAHTGLNRAKLFTDLTELSEGDTFYLHTLGTTLAYRIDQILVVEPSDISALQLERDRDYVTLVTCTPYGVNSHRLLVRGVRTEYQPEQVQKEKRFAEKSSTSTSQWMREYQKALVTGVCLVLCMGAFLLAIENRVKHHGKG